MWKQLLPAFRMTLLMTILTGLIYPAAITGLCQLLFKDQANGSLKLVDGEPVGSTLLGQNFAKPGYFHPRASNAGSAGYDGTASGGFNDGPTSKKLIDRVQAAVTKFHDENPTYQGPVPADAVTASASGLDSDISPANAEAQSARVAQARGLSQAQVHDLIAAHTKPRDLGFLGEPRINVLELNLALDHHHN
jgi:potassium-transporting ATPase KdpC subunit